MTIPIGANNLPWSFMNESPPRTPTSEALSPQLDAQIVQRHAIHSSRYAEIASPASTPPRTPPSPTSAFSISASAVSATDQPRYLYPEVSASIDATPDPTQRYLGHHEHSAQRETELQSAQDSVEAELRRLAQKQIPRGDLGRSEWRMDTLNFPLSGDHSMDSSLSPALPIPQAPPMPGNPDFQTPVRRESVNGNFVSREQELSGAVIWGTNVSVPETMTTFRTFLHQFKMLHAEEAHYTRRLEQIHLTQEYVLNIDTQHLLLCPTSRKLYNQLWLFPQIVIRILDLVAQEEYVQLFPDDEENSGRIQVRPYHLNTISSMRQLNPSDIDQLVCLKGMITRCSGLLPDLKEAFFRCILCRATTQVALDRGRIQEPTGCVKCGRDPSMEMIHNRSIFTDKQMIKMQETPDSIPEGETPYTITLFAFDDLVDQVRPGDKIEMTGIYRAVPIRVSTKQRVVKSIFRTYIDVVHFRRIDELCSTKHIAQEPSDDMEEEDVPASKEDSFGAKFWSQQDLPTRVHADFADPVERADLIQEANSSEDRLRLEAFRRIACHHDFYNILSRSVAPSIWELDDVKKGVLCMLFSGTSKSINTTENNREYQQNKQKLRSNINILLCGDPGTSKSQLLSYVHKLSQRSIYTSGKGSSAVGLTASVMRDTETGDFVLESGALVLSDQGICCIDEFDKMSESARAVLHEVMEQQTVSIAKAGIICSLNARASILASANPIGSRYNPSKSVVENINIVPTLLSRFDLIYLILDKPHADTDRKLAKHIVSLYFAHNSQDNSSSRLCFVSMKLLTEYIAYARKNVSPKLTMEAREALIRSYLSIRHVNGNRCASSDKKNITATPRQLESLIRISESLAKMRLCTAVTKENVDEALRLMMVATQRAAMDPRTGTIDMDMINTGHSFLERDAVNVLTETIKSVLQEAYDKQANSVLPSNELYKRVEERKGMDWKQSEFQMALRDLEYDNVIHISHGMIRYIGKEAMDSDVVME